MKITFKLLESNKIISNKILEALLPEIKTFTKNSFNQIKQKLPTIIINSIKLAPEYSSLINGELRLELGIPDSNTKIAGLLDIWSKNIIYTYNKPEITNNKIKSSFSIEMIKSDFSDVLGSEYSIVYDNIRGYKLPWLEWLLLDGKKTIVKNYSVVFGPNLYSRTGLAIMSPSSESWSIPSEFAGTLSNNWITRSIDSVSGDIDNLLQEIFTS